MSNIDANQVRELREKTGAGMMDCKKALVETQGNFEAAVDFLRKKGLASAGKKAGRLATEGLAWVSLSQDGRKASAVEVNCETDFVAKNDDFLGYVKDVAALAIQKGASKAEDLFTTKYVGTHFKADGTVQEALTGLIAKIGENLVLRRARTLTATGNEVLGSYVHGHGRVAVLLKASTTNASEFNQGEGAQFVKDLCMQIAAAKPDFLDNSQVTKERMDREREIYLQQAMDSGKPREIAEKMVEGKMKKFYSEICLLDQHYVKDPSLTVQKYIQQFNQTHRETFKLVEFVRFTLGEGLEKKSGDFAAEVAALQKS